ncbi:hypothetical protein HG531_003192 [Fusarium graminearum]|nr:hypothetical protein HG531_003192 [Fusarium graminearum]
MALLRLTHDIASKPDWSSSTIVFGQNSQHFVQLTHSIWALVNKTLPSPVDLVNGVLLHTRSLCQLFSTFTDTHHPEKISLGDRTMDLNALTCQHSHLGNGGEINIGAQVDQARRGKGAYTSVMTDASERVDRDSV